MLATQMEKTTATILCIDDEQTALSRLMGSRDKGGECSMSLGLRHSMQIESCLDCVQTALQPLGVGAVDPGEAIERRWRSNRARA